MADLRKTSGLYPDLTRMSPDPPIDAVRAIFAQQPSSIMRCGLKSSPSSIVQLSDYYRVLLF